MIELLKKIKMLFEYMTRFRFAYLQRLTIKIFTLAFFILGSSQLVGCKGGEAFSELEEALETVEEGEEEEDPVEITSFAPTEAPVRVANGVENTFVVSVNPGAGSVTYNWKLNNSIISGQSNSFIQIDGTITDPGLNTLEAVATNSVGSASKIFTLYKNTAPAVDSTTPGFTGNNVTCGGANTIALNLEASDADDDSLSFNWKLNGVPNHSSLNTTSLGGSSETIFTPPCSMAGPNIISVEVDDGYESTTASWAVTIVNPLIAQIIAFTPIVSPIVIQENDTQLFTVSASGQAPFNYTWGINEDPAISSGSTPSYEAAASSFPQPDGASELGNHTFTVTVTDDNGSMDNHIFNVKINSIPSLSSITPEEVDTKMNVNSTRVFSVVANDLNNDPLTYTWTLNGGTAPTGVFSGSGSSITFNPTDNQLGDNVIKLVVSDGHSLVEISNVWNVNVNHFSEECNALESGEVCTLVGPAGLGSDIDPVSTPKTAKIRPYDLVNDGNDNYFILDTAQDVVWFYNRSSAPIDVIGTTVGAGKLSVIAGVGAYGLGTAGVIPTKYQMGEPTGIAWDRDRRDLYVSVRYSNRIVRFTNNGISQHVICSGSTSNDQARHTDGAAANQHGCREPAGLGIYHNGSTRRLYVAGYRNSFIKYFDISDNDTNNWTGHILICDKNSDGACQDKPNQNGALGDDQGAGIANPWGLHVDANGLVFFTELTGCRVGVANPTSQSYSFFGGAVTVNANTAYRIGGSGNCDTYAANSQSHQNWNQQRIRHPRTILPYYNGNTYYGWFVTNYDHDAITFFNTSGSTMSIGGRSVDNIKSHIVWGNRVDGYNGNTQSGIGTLLWTPWGLAMNNANTHLMLGDSGNYRLRSLDISVGDGAVSTLITGKEKADFNGGSNTPAPEVLMNAPQGLFYDSSINTMMFTDYNNYRVRGVNTKTGLENVFVGSGCCNADVEEEDPAAVKMRNPRDVLIYNGGLIYSEYLRRQYPDTKWYAVNRSSQVRVYNRNSSPTNFFGTLVPAGKVSTIAGNFVLGMQNFNNATWLSTYEGELATSVSLPSPEGIATDGDNLYIAATRNHCINKVDSAGIITTFSGNCGNNLYGLVNGIYNDSSIKYRYPTHLVSDPMVSGGFFVVDQSDRATSRIRYINSTSSSVSIADQTIPANTVSTIFDTARGSGVAAHENWICYTSGHINRAELGSHNIICKDRTDVFGLTQFRIGPSGASDKGAVQSGREDEGVVAPGAKFYGPRRISFDNQGNLYITEFSAHTIRFVKRWW